MEHQPLSFCDQHIKNNSYGEIVGSLSFNESAENNLYSLMKLLTYYRQHVLPNHEEHIIIIKLRVLSLLQKKNHLIEDLQNLKIMKYNILIKSTDIATKIEFIRTKQIEVLKRYEVVMYLIQGRQNMLTQAESAFVANLKNCSEKIVSFQKNIDIIRSKQAAIKNHERIWNIDNELYYLHDWQVKVIRESLFLIGNEISKLYNNLSSIDEKLHDHVDKVYVNVIEQC